MIYDYLIADEGRNFIFSPFANFALITSMLQRDDAEPAHLIGLGDGGAHVGIISDGSFPTSLLVALGPRPQARRLDVSWLVKRQTRTTPAPSASSTAA